MSAAKTTATAIGIGIAGAVIAGVILLLLEYGVFNHSNPPADPETSPGSAQQDPNDTTSLTPEAVTEEPVVQSSEGPAIFAPVALSLRDAVDNERCAIEGWSGYSWKSTAPQIGGVPHPNGFSCTIVYAATSGQLDFLVPSGATRFTAAAGQTDSADNTSLAIRFEVINTITGEVLSSNDLSLGQRAEVDIPVSGITRLTLKISMLTYGTPPKEEDGEAAWGDPMFS